MHGFDYSVPHFITRVWGMRIVVTSDLRSEVLYVLRVEFANYPDYPCLRIVSKDELMSLFCETPSSWGDRQNIPCLGFAKGKRFLNMVMTFILYPLSHYNSITEPRAQFFYLFLEGLTIDFPSHFILSLIDVYKDMMTRDKLIFLFAIMWILHHEYVSHHESPHFTVMCAINAATVRQSEAQLRPKWPRTETATPPTSSVPSIFAPSSSAGGVTLDAVMAQLQCMNVHLDTLTTELYQVNTRVGRIARRQARLGGFIVSLSFSRGI